MIYHIVYVSKATVTFTLAGIENITWQSSINNQKVDISGLLLFFNGYFIQILEGDEEVVSSVFNKIKIDERHSDLEVLGAAKSHERYFENWGMGMIFVNDKNIDFFKEKLTHAEDLYKLDYESALSLLKLSLPHIK